MKKTAIASVALAAALFAVSCQKENNPVQNVSGPMTISAVSEGLNTPTKTELAFKYDVLWSSTDKIYVVDGQGNHDTFSLKEGVGTTKGTFKQDGQVTFTGEVQAYYPATMLDGGSPVWPASQTNDQTIPMYCKKTLSGEAEERMDFSSLGSVLQIVFNTAQENVTLKSIEIKDGSATLSGAFTVGTDGKAVITATDKAGITLDLGTGAALGKAANYFNIVVPAGNYQDLTLVFTATDGKKCTMTGGKVNIAHNTVGRLTLIGEKFKGDLPDGALPGVFTVADDGQGNVKKVHFSQGNLTYSVTDTKWSFFEHQHYRAGNGSASTTLISLFTWGYGNWSTDPYHKIYLEGHTSDGETFNPSEDWGSQIGDGKTWRTLTSAEWQYLFDTRKMENGGARFENLTSSGITVEGVTFYGMVLFPDDFTDQADWKTKYTTWKALDDAGIVFLPAAGFRNGNGVTHVDSYAYYWSSNAGDNIYRARRLFFSDQSVKPVSVDGRNLGFGVRLITECQ